MDTIDRIRGGHRVRHAVGRAATLLVIMGTVYLINMVPAATASPAGITLRLGFLLLASYLAGQLANDLQLPKITGYLFLGVLAGPYVAGLLSVATVGGLRLVNEIALSLIALSAGGELRLGAVWKRLRSIATITTVQIVVVFAVVTGVVFFARETIGFLGEQPERSVWAAALLFGLVAVAKSPATTIAVITEEKARGVLTDTVLGITIIKDVIILIMIAVLIPLSVTIADPAATFDASAVEEVLLAIALSIAAGALFGWLMVQFLKHLPGQQVLIVLAAAFLSAVLGELLHLEYILISMAAGFVVQNYSEQGAALIDALEANALPIYALFFAVAGAGLNLTVLSDVWRFALLIIVARMVAIFGATWLGGWMAGDPASVRNYAWTGFLAKAGVTLGIANMIRDRFPDMGAEIAAVIIAMIAINQFIGPPLFRWGLVQADESRRARVPLAGVTAPAPEPTRA